MWDQGEIKSRGHYTREAGTRGWEFNSFRYPWLRTIFISKPQQLNLIVPSFLPFLLSQSDFHWLCNYWLLFYYSFPNGRVEKKMEKDLRWWESQVRFAFFLDRRPPRKERFDHPGTQEKSVEEKSFFRSFFYEKNAPISPEIFLYRKLRCYSSLSRNLRRGLLALLLGVS